MDIHVTVEEHIHDGHLLRMKVEVYADDGGQDEGRTRGSKQPGTKSVLLEWPLRIRGFVDSSSSDV